MSEPIISSQSLSVMEEPNFHSIQSVFIPKLYPSSPICSELRHLHPCSLSCPTSKLSPGEHGYPARKNAAAVCYQWNGFPSVFGICQYDGAFGDVIRKRFLDTKEVGLLREGIGTSRANLYLVFWEVWLLLARLSNLQPEVPPIQILVDMMFYGMSTPVVFSILRSQSIEQDINLNSLENRPTRLTDPCHQSEVTIFAITHRDDRGWIWSRSVGEALLEIVTEIERLSKILNSKSPIRISPTLIRRQVA
jgi:hypothetical protein